MRMLRLLTLLVIALAPALAAAQTLKVLTAGAMKPLVQAVAPGFEGRTGVRVEVQNDTAGALMKRIQAGEAFDVAIVTDAGARTLAAPGGPAASARPLAKVGIGVAVKQGSAVPPLATVDDFRRTLLAARRVALIDPASGGSSGIYLAGLFQRLGMADAMAAKSLLVPGGLTAARLVSGEADLAVQQASELVAVDGVFIAGMLPAEIQNFTTYGAAVARNSRLSDAAELFVAALARVAGTGALKEIGIEPPAAP